MSVEEQIGAIDAAMAALARANAGGLSDEEVERIGDEVDGVLAMPVTGVAACYAKVRLLIASEGELLEPTMLAGLHSLLDCLRAAPSSAVAA